MPTAIPTLTELATIAHTNRCSVVATHRRHVLLDDTASPLPFLGMRFGLAVEAVAALTTIGRSSWPSTVPARRSPSTRLPVESKAMSNASLRSIPHAAPSGLPLGRADARCGRSRTSSGSIAFSPPRSTRRSAIHLSGSNLAACTPLTEAGPPSSPEVLAHHTRHQPATWAALRAGSIEGTTTWTPVRPALASWFDEGSFARHCFASLPDLDIVAADLHELLGPSGWRRVLSGLARP